MRCPTCGKDEPEQGPWRLRESSGITWAHCPACLTQCRETSAIKAASRSALEELVAAHKEVRWDTDHTSRNPHYFDAIATSRRRLARAVERVVGEE